MAIHVRRNGAWVPVGGAGVDATLTKPGVAADAAVTGAMIEDLRKLYDESKITNIILTNWNKGDGTGEFEITYTDGSSAIFSVEFDGLEQPTKIIDSTGTVVNIQW